MKLTHGQKAWGWLGIALVNVGLSGLLGPIVGPGYMLVSFTVGALAGYILAGHALAWKDERDRRRS